MVAPADVTFRDAGIPFLLRAVDFGARGLEALGVQLVPLSADDLVARAMRKTGLSDFGEESWREGLDVLVDAFDREGDLTALGRASVRGMLGAVLCVRLQVVDWISRHPEVLDERITAPWVVVGLPRTGTTLLSFLLDLDPENRSLLHWEAASPVPPPALATAAEDPRIAEARGQVDGLHRLNPSLRAMHPMGATLPTECVTLLAQDFRSIHFETQFPAPSYGAWLDGQDLSSSYAHHRRMLQLLQSRIPTAHWSLKTPYHLWQLGTLRETYPDARVIWTHRDPAQVVPSVASLNTAFHRTWCRNPDPVAIGHSWNEKLHTGLSRGMAYDAGRDDPDWCAHLQYTELMKDPVGSVQRLYSHFGCEVSPLHERRMRAWMEQRPQQQFGRHRYDPADFGFSEHGIRVEYAAYLERFDVERETG